MAKKKQSSSGCKKNLFVTSVSCMDGRIQLPLTQFLKKRFKAKYVDVITEPGPIKNLSTNENPNIVESIKKRVEISVSAHGSKVVAISGHFDCAGNPVNKETQINQINLAAEQIKKWGYNIKIIKLWVDENWKVREIK